ncbi:MAG: hypothetical protein ABI947_27645 [Chloroflexota bacterium]
MLSKDEVEQHLGDIAFIAEQFTKQTFGQFRRWLTVIDVSCTI